jgi:hypothetical protein
MDTQQPIGTGTGSVTVQRSTPIESKLPTVTLVPVEIITSSEQRNGLRSRIVILAFQLACHLIGTLRKTLALVGARHDLARLPFAHF